MNFLSDFLGFAGDKDFSLPVFQVCILMIVLTFCMLTNRNRLGLISSYVFVTYWGFMENRKVFLTLFGEPTAGLYLYVFFCFVAGAVTLYSFFSSGGD